MNVAYQRFWIQFDAFNQSLKHRPHKAAVAGFFRLSNEALYQRLDVSLGDASHPSRIIRLCLLPLQLQCKQGAFLLQFVNLAQGRGGVSQFSSHIQHATDLCRTVLHLGLYASKGSGVRLAGQQRPGRLEDLASEVRLAQLRHDVVEDPAVDVSP